MKNNSTIFHMPGSRIGYDACEGAEKMYGKRYCQERSFEQQKEKEQNQPFSFSWKEFFIDMLWLIGLSVLVFLSVWWCL